MPLALALDNILPPLAYFGVSDNFNKPPPISFYVCNGAYGPHKIPWPYFEAYKDQTWGVRYMREELLHAKHKVDEPKYNTVTNLINSCYFKSYESSKTF